MPEHLADRNLLFGILALQNGFVSREDLLAAVSVWLADKSQRLSEILLARQSLAQDEFELLTALVGKHLDKHGGNVEQSLAALSSLESAGEALARLGDADVDATLSFVARRALVEKHERQPAADEPPGRQRFRILRPHAKGGLGEVFVARDEDLNREVALKEIQAHHADNPASRQRFVLEAEITGGLEHPGIVPVYGLGQYGDGRPYYAMRFIRGDSLKEAVDRFNNKKQTAEDAEDRGEIRSSLRPSAPSAVNYLSLEFRQLLGRFIDVCQAIEYAHSRGVLHRDLKPGNIMLGKYGETLVVDWGLAKVKGRDESTKTDDETTLQPASASGSAPTQMGQALGTPAYMSPEQAAGRLDQLGPAADVYSLGATLYYVLTGQAPFGREDLATTLRKVQSGEFPAPRALDTNIPRPLEAICLKAMSVSTGDRYSTPAALADDVEKWLADEPIATHAEPVSLRVRRWLRKHPKTVGSIAATFLVSFVSLASIAAVVGRSNHELATVNQELERSNQRERDAKENALAVNKQLELTNGRLDGANVEIAIQNDSLKEERDRAKTSTRNFLDLYYQSLHARDESLPVGSAEIAKSVGLVRPRIYATINSGGQSILVNGVMRQYVDPDSEFTWSFKELKPEDFAAAPGIQIRFHILRSPYQPLGGAFRATFAIRLRNPKSGVESKAVILEANEYSAISCQSLIAVHLGSDTAAPADFYKTFVASGRTDVIIQNPTVGLAYLGLGEKDLFIYQNGNSVNQTLVEESRRINKIVAALKIGRSLPASTEHPSLPPSKNQTPIDRTIAVCRRAWDQYEKDCLELLRDGEKLRVIPLDREKEIAASVDEALKQIQFELNGALDRNDNAEALFGIALKGRLGRTYGESQLALEAAAALNPKFDAYRRFLRAEQAFSTADLSTALSEFTAAIAVNDNLAEAYRRRGIIREQLGETGAEEDSARAWALDESLDAERRVLPWQSFPWRESRLRDVERVIENGRAISTQEK